MLIIKLVAVANIELVLAAGTLAEVSAFNSCLVAFAVLFLAIGLFAVASSRVLLLRGLLAFFWHCDFVFKRVWIPFAELQNCLFAKVFICYDVIAVDAVAILAEFPVLEAFAVEFKTFRLFTVAGHFFGASLLKLELTLLSQCFCAGFEALREHFPLCGGMILRNIKFFIMFRSPIVTIASLLLLGMIVEHLLIFGARSLLLGGRIKGVLGELLMDSLLISKSLNSLIVLNIHFFLRDLIVAIFIGILLKFGRRRREKSLLASYFIG